MSFEFVATEADPGSGCHASEPLGIEPYHTRDGTRATLRVPGSGGNRNPAELSASCVQ